MNGKYKSNMIPVLIISGKFITNQYQITGELANFFAEVHPQNTTLVSLLNINIKYSGRDRIMEAHAEEYFLCT